MKLPLIIVMIFQLIVMPACAGIMAATTRVIYPADAREKSLMVVNTNPYPVILQTWVDQGAGDPETAKAAFISLPPVFRLEPGEMKGVRIIYNHESLPQDRESLFWLNLYEIPPEKKEKGQLASDLLMLMMNTQLKIFYRPEGLILTPEQAVKKLSFRLLHEGENWFVECHNPGPLHISFTSIMLLNGKQEQDVRQEADMMVPPFSKRRYPVSALSGPPAENGRIRFHYLDDNGVLLTHETPL